MFNPFIFEMMFPDVLGPIEARKQLYNSAYSACYQDLDYESWLKEVIEKDKRLSYMLSLLSEKELYSIKKLIWERNF